MRAPSILKQSTWTYIKEYALITLGILIYASSWVLFLTPHNLVGGGVTGIGVILAYATGGMIPLSATYFTLNVLLLIASFFILGKAFGGKTIYAILLATAAFAVMPELPGIDVLIRDLALKNGPLLCTIMGGILAGTGIGMSISQGGSTGGTDIVALIWTKFHNVSPGKVILWIDVFIIGSSFFVPSYRMVDGVETMLAWPEKVTTVVYGILLVTICGSVIDLYLNGSKQSIQLFILSKKADEIAEAVTKEMHRGVTVLDGMGWYTKEHTKVLMVITRKTDQNLLLRYIKTIDPNAFLSISSVSGVYGKGFEMFKGDAKVPKEQTRNSQNT